jgi:superfamily II DNA helicase RecQ
MCYADVGRVKEKDQIQQQWRNANGRVVVASNAFGLGIGQPDVQVVIHVWPIHRMRDYGQESGRGGRDGQRSEAIILVGVGRQDALQRQQAQSRGQPPARSGVITSVYVVLWLLD